MVADLPPDLPEPILCCIEAAAEYHIPKEVVLAVAQAENGQVGLWKQNSNKTFDVGVMQFNTGYLATLKQHGITPELVETSGCYPYRLAAWRIQQHLLNDPGDYWSRVANYHSRTPKFNQRYQTVLVNFYNDWLVWFKDPSKPLPWAIKNPLKDGRKIITNQSSHPLPMSFEDYLKTKGF